MLPNLKTLLCSYRYDPLDRLVDSTPSAQSALQRFYLKDRLATEIQGVVQCSIMQHDDQLLAQQERQGSKNAETSLLATDQQRSVLNVLDTTRLNPLAYTPYGHRPATTGLLSLLGFNGERPDLVTGCYLLGNGYRAFNPVLMRFNSPDSWSPFGEGGLNMYAYCGAEPVSRSDRTGHTWLWIKSIMRSLNLMKPSTRGANHLRTTSVISLDSLLDNNAVKQNPLYRSSHRSISSQSSTSTITSIHSQDSVYNQPSNNSANRQITQRTGPLPPLPPSARLHAEWSSPKPEFRPSNIYDLPKQPVETIPSRFERVLSGNFPMETIYELPRKSLRHLDAEKIIERGKLIRYK